MDKTHILALSISALVSFKELINGSIAFAESPKNVCPEGEKSDFIPFLQVENLTFEQFMMGIDLSKIPSQGVNNLRSLYEETNKLEKDERFEEAYKKWMEFDIMLDKYLGNELQSAELSGFKDFMKCIPTKKVPSDAMKKLRNIYDDAIKLERSYKFDEADKKWDRFYKMLAKYLDSKFQSISLPSFNEFMRDMPTGNISEDTMGKLEVLYDDITQLERSNNLDKAGERWDEFYKILEKYIELN